MNNEKSPAILCVANWKSDVGYAWWLMESYWIKLSEIYSLRYRTLLAYPEINSVPAAIENSAIEYFHHTFACADKAGIKANVALIKKENIKVLYLSDYGVTHAAFAAYRAAGVEKIIVHDHTPGLRTRASGIKKWLKTIRANMPGLRADAAFGATEFVTSRLINTSCFSPSRCFTIQNGIVPFDAGLADDKQTPAFFPSADKKVIVTAARANKYKGVEFALHVMAELTVKRGRRDVSYMLFGDGPDLEAFKALAETLNITAYCHFPGRVDNAKLWFSRCYLGFQPSKGEVGYSLSILEYMYARLPVIVPDNPSVCEATTDSKNGAVYKENDVQSAANAIAHYLDNPQIQKEHGEAAHSVVDRQYTLASTHAAFSQAVQQVIGKAV